MSQIQTSNWSQTAASNNAASPNGFPEGMAPSGLNDSDREMMSALKIDWANVHGVDSAGALLPTAGTSTAYTLTFSTAPATLYTAFIFGCKIHTDCGADPTINVNALGAVNIQKMTTTGYVNLAAGDLKTGQHPLFKYDGTLAKVILLTPAASHLADPLTTRGDLIVRGASSTTRLPIGAANRFLQSDGTDPSWGQVDLAASDVTGVLPLTSVNIDGATLVNNPANAGFIPIHDSTAAAQRKARIGEVGGWVPLEEQTAAASATLSFVLTSYLTGFEDFELIIHHLRPTTDDVHLWIRTDSDAGASYDAGLSDYSWWTEWTSDGVGTSNDSDFADAQIVITGNTAANTLSNVAGEGFTGRIFVTNPAAALPCIIQYGGHYIAADTHFNIVKGWGRRETSADVDAIRIMASSGTLASGKITLMGRRKVT